MYRTKNKKQKGFTLLEYVAGAAVIIGIVWLAVSAMGTSLSGVFTAIGEWANGRAGQINSGNGGGNNP